MNEPKQVHHYYVINKETCYVFQYIKSSVEGWSVDNEADYSIELDDHYNILGAYLIDGKWYHREWNALDENGMPIESEGYVDIEFIPELVTE